MAKSLALERFKARLVRERDRREVDRAREQLHEATEQLKHPSPSEAPVEPLDEELAEELIEEEPVTGLEDAATRARLRRLEARHRRYARREALSVAQAKANLVRSMEQLSLRGLGLDALQRARAGGGFAWLNVLRRRPIESAVAALVAGMVVGAFPGLRRGLASTIGWAAGLFRR